MYGFVEHYYERLNWQYSLIALQISFVEAINLRDNTTLQL